jgi:hypothetical protein
MPNWCVNQLDITGDESEVARLIEFVKGGGDGFDFAKIVPPPDSPFYSISDKQNHFQCGCEPVYVELPELPQVVAYTDSNGNDVMRNQGEWRVGDLPVKKEVIGNGTIEAFVEAGFGGSEVCPIHNETKNSLHPDWWYNWNVANWGTKWNCHEVWNDREEDANVFAGRTSYNFDTAWSPAEPVVAALSGLFPTLVITHRYCEGGNGYAGQVVYHSGNEVSRDEYSGDNDNLPDEAWFVEEDGSRSYERDYDKVPATAFEAFCDEHFGGVVGG